MAVRTAPGRFLGGTPFTEPAGIALEALCGTASATAETTASEGTLSLCETCEVGAGPLARRTSSVVSLFFFRRQQRRWELALASWTSLASRNPASYLWRKMLFPRMSSKPLSRPLSFGPAWQLHPPAKRL